MSLWRCFHTTLPFYGFRKEDPFPDATQNIEVLCPVWDQYIVGCLTWNKVRTADSPVGRSEHGHAAPPLGPPFSGCRVVEHRQKPEVSHGCITRPSMGHGTGYTYIGVVSGVNALCILLRKPADRLVESSITKRSE